MPAGVPIYRCIYSCGIYIGLAQAFGWLKNNIERLLAAFGWLKNNIERLLAAM